jgi:two-component system invasion response regulator UvrY
MIRVLIADDHPLLRAGLKSIINDSGDASVVVEASDGHQALKALRETKVDVAILDMMMPGRNGIELLSLVKVQFPAIKVLVLSSQKEDVYALRAIKAGASGYLCKDLAGEYLLEAIRKVAKGGSYISQAVGELLTQEVQNPKDSVHPHTQLSDREFQVFMLLISGLRPTDIANELHLSIKTVSTHLSRIKEKMLMESVPEMVRYGIRNSLIQEELNPD